MSVQTSGAFISKSIGPGWILKFLIATNIIAAVAEVGRPSARSGTRTPAALALFAASGPATPSIAPFPNSSLFFDNFFSTE